MSSEPKAIDRYLKRLRALVPARTMALYTAITGLYPMLALKSSELPVWLPFFAIGACLAFQITIGIVKDSDKKWYHILLSGIAFFLYGLTQPYMGILGVFEASAEVHLVFSIIIVVFVSIVPILVKDFGKDNSA